MHKELHIRKRIRKVSKLCFSYINVLMFITLRRLVIAHPQRKLGKLWRKVMQELIRKGGKVTNSQEASLINLDGRKGNH